MAFLDRIGNLVKNTVSKNVMSELSAPSSSLFQAIRSFSSAKLLIGGLSDNTDETSLRETFSQYGEIVEAKVITDRETGRSRGYGFVTYTAPEAASSAIQAFNGQDLHGRRVRVNFATEKPQGGFGGGGVYGGRGSYGGGGYGGGSKERTLPVGSSLTKKNILLGLLQESKAAKVRATFYSSFKEEMDNYLSSIGEDEGEFCDSLFSEGARRTLEKLAGIKPREQKDAEAKTEDSSVVNERRRIGSERWQAIRDEDDGDVAILALSKFREMISPRQSGPFRSYAALNSRKNKRQSNLPKRRISLPTHYLEVNYNTSSVVVFAYPKVAHIPLDEMRIKEKDLNLL